jgi:hypothetical protein
MAKTDLFAISSPASQPLKNSKHERYCRLRAALLPRAQAFREAGWNDARDEGAYNHACRLERRPGVAARIEFLSHRAEDLITEKRRRIEEWLWAVHEVDFGAFWETYEIAKTSRNGEMATDQDGKMLTVRKQRAKLINDLPLELRRLIESVTVDRHGNIFPQVYSKDKANRGLRELLNLGRIEDRPESDVLSDAELIQQLSEQAKQLGVKIDLSYSFLQQQSPPASAGDGEEPNAAINATATDDGTKPENA